MQRCETFTNSSTHVRNLFLAFGNAELINEIASYTKDVG
jgi:hypothetical protein